MGERSKMRRPSHATVVAYLALFVALSSGAYAVTVARKNSVTSKSIKNGQVKNPDLANGAVTNPKLADNAVTGAKVADGSLTGSDLGAGTIGAGQLGAGAVGTSNLADGSVTGPKIGDGSVGTSKLGDGSVTGGKIAPGAVDTGQLAPNSVTGAKVAPGSLTGANIDQSSLDFNLIQHRPTSICGNNRTGIADISASGTVTCTDPLVPASNLPSQGVELSASPPQSNVTVLQNPSGNLALKADCAIVPGPKVQLTLNVVTTTANSASVDLIGGDAFLTPHTAVSITAPGSQTIEQFADSSNLVDRGDFDAAALGISGFFIAPVGSLDGQFIAIVSSGGPGICYVAASASAS